MSAGLFRIAGDEWFGPTVAAQKQQPIAVSTVPGAGFRSAIGN